MHRPLQGPPPPAFAVVLTWPSIQNAEYEVVQRVLRAAANIGALAWVVDNDGYPLWSNDPDQPCPERRLTRNDCAFVISLHFESPRFYDIPSYTALWNPPEFYVSFGYGRTIAQLASHMDVLSCRSEVADAHAANLYTGLDRTLPEPFPPLFHGVPRPYPEPCQDESSRLFYVGINWERISGEKGRHHQLLQQLDAEDLISIYGPEKLLGIAPWQGFATYRGSIPFDGASVVARINEAGICLALSSKAHQVSGIMSNRLFEALAGGAVIIANPHPFIDKYFADLVHVVDDRAPTEEIVAQIRELVLRVRADPAEARCRARLGQERLAQAFSLEDSLGNLFAVHADRVAHFERRSRGDTRHEVTVIIDAAACDGAAVDRLLAKVSAQVAVTVDVLLLGAADAVDRMGGQLGPAIRSIRAVPLELDVLEDGKALRRSAASGQAFAEALGAVRTPFFCTMQADDDWLSEHLATLAHTLDRSPDSSFACSGKIEESEDAEGVIRRRFESLTFEQFEALAEAAYPRDAGRFLFRSTLIPKLPRKVFGVLDALEHRLLALWAFLEGPPAQTHYATYVRALDVTADLPVPFFSEAEQQEVIRDTVRGRSAWLVLVSSLRQLRPITTAQPERAELTLDRSYAMRSRGDGLALLQSGFSAPEETGIWVDGREGVLAFKIAGADAPARAEIVFSALGRPATEDGASQRCSVLVNGQVAGRVMVGPHPAQFRVPVPPTVDLEGGALVVLRLRHADPVLDTGGDVLDSRRLGLHLIAFGMKAAADTLAPTLAPDRLYTLNMGGDGTSFAVEGFSPPERDFSWVDGPSAALAFSLDEGQDQPCLVLVAMGRPSLENGAQQVCAVSLDGAVVGHVALSERLERHTLPLPSMQGGRSYRLTLDLRHAEPPAEGGDMRRLGMALQQFGLLGTAVRSISPATGRGLLRRGAGALRERLRR